MSKKNPASVSRNGRNTFDAPSTIPDQLQPSSKEAEEAVIGSLLIDPDAIITISTFLQPDHFFIQRLGWVFDACKILYARREAIDLVTLCEELESRELLEEIGGSAYLTGLLNATPTSINVLYYAKIVERKAILRRLINVSGRISQLAFKPDPDASIPEILEQAESLIFSVGEQNSIRTMAPVSQGVSMVLDRIEYMSENKNKIVGLPTGIQDLDRLLGGLQKEEMIVVAGRPGMGKSALALTLARNVAGKGKQVGLFSLEMSDFSLALRLLSSESGVDSQRLKFGKVQGDELARLVEATRILSGMGIYIDDSPSLSAIELRSKARRLHAEVGLDLIIVDYLQLMTAGQRTENRQAEVSIISRSIKALARELKVPVVALSQLSRAVDNRATDNRRPILSDLRESGSIEQDADIVLFIYRDDVYNPDTEFPNIAEFIVAKHRSGPTGTFSVYFQKQLTRFVDLEVRKTPLEYEQIDPEQKTRAEWTLKD